MKDINIYIDSKTHKVTFDDEFLGIGGENLQGNIIFHFDNEFPFGEARLDTIINCQSGVIDTIPQYGNTYVLPIKSSLLQGDNIIMQLIVDEVNLATYTLTKDTKVNPKKAYYTRSGSEGSYIYTLVTNPIEAELPTYYELNMPVFKSDIFSIKVRESINAEVPIYEEYENWIERANALLEQINQALIEVGNLDIEAQRVEGGVEITITRKDGTTETVMIYDGQGAVPTKVQDVLLNDTSIVNSDKEAIIPFVEDITDNPSNNKLVTEKDYMIM